jgi:hypothetical protein
MASGREGRNDPQSRIRLVQTAQALAETYRSG